MFMTTLLKNHMKWMKYGTGFHGISRDFMGILYHTHGDTLLWDITKQDCENVVSEDWN
jgi:hypothetical protein